MWLQLVYLKGVQTVKRAEEFHELDLLIDDSKDSSSLLSLLSSASFIKFSQWM